MIDCEPRAHTCGAGERACNAGSTRVKRAARWSPTVPRRGSRCGQDIPAERATRADECRMGDAEVSYVPPPPSPPATRLRAWGGDGGDAHTCGCVCCGDGASADATVASAHIATVHSSVVARALPRGILEACGNEPVLATRRKPAPAVKAAGASSQERKRRCGESPRRTLDCACPSGGLEVVGFRASGAPFSAGWRAQRVWSMWPRWHGGACVDPARRNGVGG